MEKLFLINFNSKQNLLEEVARQKIKVLFKTQNSVVIKTTEAKANRLTRLGYTVQQVHPNLSKMRGAAAPIVFNKIKGKAELRGKEIASNTYYYILKFVGPVLFEWLQRLKKDKVEVVKPLNDFSFIVKGKSEAIKRIKKRTEILFVLPYHPVLKIHPSLLGKRSRDLQTSDLTFKNLDAAHFPHRLVEIALFKSANFNTINKTIQKLGIHTQVLDKRVIQAEVGTLNIEEIAKIEGIDTIYPYYPTEMDNDISSGITQVDDARTQEELDGTGQIVGVFDSGLDTGVNDGTMHADLQGRIVSLTAKTSGTVLDDEPGHGTHVAATVCGDGSANGGTWAGMAPAAQLAFVAHDEFVNSTTVMTDAFDTMIANGAQIVNNSWGKNENSAYDLWSEAIDEYVWDNRNFLPVFTAGNDGRDTDGDGVTDVDALRSTGAAKNCITVGGSENLRPAGSTPGGGAIGATYNGWTDDPSVALPISTDDISDNIEGMYHRSSRGPTDDGRIKPDVVAPATNILSARSSVYDTSTNNLNTYWPSASALSGLYAFSQGTSMAAPQVTGIAVLIKQYLADRRGYNEPSAALLKAIIINGTQQMLGQYNTAATNPHNDAGATVPNSIQGWGRANIMDSLFPSGTERIQFSDRLEYALMTGETKIFEVHVSDSLNPLTICMCYTDAPGSGIINQLYLQVEQPDTTFIDGDYNIDGTINPYADIATNGVINNVQKVAIAAPAPGTYRIHVHAYNVSMGITPSPRTDLAADVPVQDFALVVANATGFSANPVSVVQVFDRSQSMNTFGYTDPAKQRAKEFADFLQINDKHAVVSFNTAATEEYASTLISSSTDIEDAKDAIDLITPSGRTSIGSGVDMAQGLFTADGMPHAMVLFSDGFSNEPPYAVSPPDGSAPIIDAAFIATDTVIYTIALGATADSTRLTDIATLTGGNFYTIDSLASIYELNEIYYNIQALTGSAVLVDYGTDIVPAADSDSDKLRDKRSLKSKRKGMAKAAPLLGGININTPAILNPSVIGPFLNNGVIKSIPFVVDLSTQIRVCVSTNQDSPDFDLYLEDPDGVTYSKYTAGSKYIVGEDYKHLIVELPKTGAWKLKVQSFQDAEFNFSYAIFSNALNDLEIEADEYVKVNTQPVFDINAKFGDFVLTNQNVEVFSKGSPKVSNLLTKNKSALAKVKIDPKKFADPVTKTVKLELLNQKLKKGKKASLFTAKTNIKKVSMAKKQNLKVEGPKMTAIDALRHDIKVSGTYRQDGQTYSFTRKKMICQQVRSKVPAAGALKIVDIWSTYGPSKTNNKLYYQKPGKSGETILGVKVTGPKGRPVKLSDKYSFSASVTANGKKIGKLRWTYRKDSQSFVTQLPKLKGRIAVTAKLKVKGKTRSKKLSWKQ